nr:retrovirus-related Pol polyprotein from transposon TNT 1-94 [Tanacetum cinerariifolium]
ILAQHLTAATYSASSEDIATDCCFLAHQQTNFPLIQGLEYLSVKYISDLIIPLYEVSLTGLPARPGPKLFGGTIGVFTEELSEMSYFLSFDLKGYSDSNYAGCNMDRKSTSGACQILSGKLVCWCAKKQQSVAMSSDEAEYVAAVGCFASIL